MESRTKPVFDPRTHVNDLARHVLPEVQIESIGGFRVGVRLESPPRSDTVLLLV